MRVAKAFVDNAESVVPAADDQQWLANSDASALPVSLPAAIVNQP
jgi:hypothetical protein